MFRKFLLFSLVIFTNSFFTPTIKLSSGKSLTISGKGPPILFSTGLYGTMPRQFYNQLINNLKKNVTVITIDGFDPIVKDDIEDVVEKLRVDSIAYLSHSSFNPDVLETDKLNSAVLLDPICIPTINFNGIKKPYANVNYPILIIRAEKLYNTEVPLPEWQEIEIDGDVIDEIYNDVGHPDILDDSWSNFAKQLGFWGTAEGEIMEFKNWQNNMKTTVPKIRKEYRKYTANKVIEFINK